MGVDTTDFEGTKFFFVWKKRWSNFAAHDMLCKCYQTKYVLLETATKKFSYNFVYYITLDAKTKSEFL